MSPSEAGRTFLRILTSSAALAEKYGRRGAMASDDDIVAPWRRGQQQGQSALLLFLPSSPSRVYRVNALSLESILASDVVTCGADEALGEVLRTMERRRISCVVVTDEDRRPCGIFTERDAVALLAEDALSPASPVAEVMSRPVVRLPLAVDYRDAYQHMLM